MKEFKSTWWSIELLSDWSAAQEDSCISIWSENGVGALQISAFQHEDQPVTETALVQFAEDEYPESAQRNSESWGEFSGLCVSFSENGSYWQKWFLRKGSLLLFATYTCGADEQDKAVVQVRQMLATLKSKLPAT